MYPNLAHLPGPPHPPLAPTASSPKNPTTQKNQSKTKSKQKHLAPPSFRHLFTHPSDIGCCSVSRSTPLS